MKTRELMTKTNRSQAGFTLIELMIVIAIIGILAAVAIPNFLRARNQAMFTSCLESMSAIKVAEEMFIIDNNAYTTDAALLAMYMSATCVDPTGTDGTCLDPATGQPIVSARLAAACDAVNYAAPTLTLNPAFTVVIQGVARDRDHCAICVGATGVRPESYADCFTDGTTNGAFHADCANL